MKRIAIKLFGIAAISAFGCFFSSVNAQQSNNNTIQEVKINSNDGFTELKNLIAQNFDFTNPDLSEGVTKNVVKFEISESGKLNNIHAEGNCKYISQELESVLSHLQYRFKADKQRPYTYVMPIEVAIASR